MSKIDIVLGHIITIKEDIGAIKQHSKDINGNIERHEKSINNLNKKTYWIMGVGSAIVLIIGLVIKFL